MNVFIQLRLTGRPEMERTPWITKDYVDKVMVLTDQGRVPCVPTGDYEGDNEVWVPEDKRDYWQAKAE